MWDLIVSVPDHCLSFYFDNLVESGALEKVSHNEWATPIIPVPKPNGNVRICGDFKVTVNPVLESDKYPLPRTEDIFASLSEGQMVSKIGLIIAYLFTLKDAYLPIEVDVSTTFQHIIEQVMSGIPGTQVILDDMIVTGKTIRNI